MISNKTAIVIIIGVGYVVPKLLKSIIINLILWDVLEWYVNIYTYLYIVYINK
jgi:hypothetical protein